MSFSILTIAPPPTLTEQIISALSPGDVSTSNNVLLVNEDLDTIGYKDLSTVLNKSYGQITLIDNITSQIPATTNTWTNLSNPTYTFSTINLNFEMSSNGTLKYIGTVPNVAFMVSVHGTAFIVGGTENYRIRIAKNGAAVQGSDVLTTLKTEAAGAAAFSCNALVRLTTNDTINVQIFGVNNIVAFTAKYLCLTVNTV